MGGVCACRHVGLTVQPEAKGEDTVEPEVEPEAKDEDTVKPEAEDDELKQALADIEEMEYLEWLDWADEMGIDYYGSRGDED